MTIGVSVECTVALLKTRLSCLLPISFRRFNRCQEKRRSSFIAICRGSWNHRWSRYPRGFRRRRTVVRRVVRSWKLRDESRASTRSMRSGGALERDEVLRALDTGCQAAIGSTVADRLVKVWRVWRVRVKQHGRMLAVEEDNEIADG